MFASREQAGRLLGERLQYLSSEKPVVLGITRGGVVVAAEVAKNLEAPLYPLVVKKIACSWDPEFAVGAMGPDGEIVPDMSDLAGISDKQIQETRRKIQEKIQEYGIKNLSTEIKNRTVIIVDDGVATGFTIRAAVRYVTGSYPVKVVVAVPVADREVIRLLGSKVDSFEVLEEVDGLGAVGNFYENFEPVTDEEVVTILKSLS